MAKQAVNVFVFGAGASDHLKAPLMKDFIYSGINLLCDDKSVLKNDISVDSFRLVVQFLDDLNGTQLMSKIKEAVKYNEITPRYYIPNTTIEDLLTFVDLGLANQESWRPSFKSLQRALYDFIFETLDNKISKLPSLSRDDDSWSRSSDSLPCKKVRQKLESFFAKVVSEIVYYESFEEYCEEKLT